MSNPTRAEVQIIIDNLTNVLPLAQKIEKRGLGSINMHNGSIQDDARDSCHTPMCHAGWYLIGATPKNKSIKSKSYLDGQILMVEHLGFDKLYKLLDWAHLNPRIWGNKNGSEMFRSNNKAFNYDGTLTLAKIINHWKGVQERLPE